MRLVNYKHVAIYYAQTFFLLFVFNFKFMWYCHRIAKLIFQVFYILNNQIFVLTLKKRLKCFVSYWINLILNNFTSDARFVQRLFLTEKNEWSVNNRKTWTSINWIFKYFKSTWMMITTNHSSILISNITESMISSSNLFSRNFESS